MQDNYICLVAGRSGGHIVPAMTYAQQLLHKDPETTFLFFSTHTKLDKNLVALYPFITHYIPLTLENLPGKKIYKYPQFIAQLIWAFFMSLKNLVQYKPKKIISMGGYISIPVCLAARLLRIPVELFELNAIPGRATGFLARFASTIHICFEQARTYFKNSSKWAHVMLTPYPLRFTPADRVTKAHACVQLGLDPAKPVLLILGGSQGSKFINNLFTEFAQLLKSKEPHPLILSLSKDQAGGEPSQKVAQVQVIHQTGAVDSPQVETVYSNHAISAHVFDYKADLQLFYCAADLVVARAGAGTLFELKFFQKSSIIIPLETKITDHQVANALALAQEHPELFTVIRQASIEHDREDFFKLLLKKLINS